MFGQETAYFGCDWRRCDFSDRTDCKAVKGPVTGVERVECREAHVCPIPPTQPEQDSMKSECSKYGGVFSIKEEHGCSFPDCSLDGLSEDQCPTALAVEKQFNACKLTGGESAVGFVKGCKRVRCEREADACISDPDMETKVVDGCKAEGKSAVKKFDGNGCQYLICGEPDECDKEPPAVATTKCAAKGGEFVLSKDSNGCIEFAECVLPPEEDVYVEPIKELPDITVLLEVAIKLEELKIHLDSIGINLEALKAHYESAGNEAQVAKFEKAVTIIKEAIKEIDTVKDNMRERLEKFTVDELTQIKVDLAGVKNKLRELLFVLLHTETET